MLGSRCISTNPYYKQVDVILEVLEDEAGVEVKQAGQRLCKLILEESDEVSSTGVLDIAVTFDGTWSKRGFTSLTGAFFVISLDTGGRYWTTMLFPGPVKSVHVKNPNVKMMLMHLRNGR